jgi:hypothetical protein
MGNKFSLNAFHLKLIAMLFMFVDHFGVMVLNPSLFEWSLGWYIPSRIAGRIAFPIFAFLVVEAVQHTKNIYRYWLRLALMGLSIGFAMWILNSQFNFVLFSGNIFVDLLIGAIFIYGLENGLKHFYFFLILPFYLVIEVYLPFFFQADYGTYGWLIMILFWSARKITQRFDILNLPQSFSSSIVAAILLFITHAAWYVLSTQEGLGVSIQSFAFLAAIFIGFYNGLPGHQSKAFKLFSYGFYPLHFAVIYVILLGLMFLSF